MSSYAGPPAAFRPGDGGVLRLVVYLALALALIFFDRQAGWLRTLRTSLGLATQPVYALVGLPGQVGRHLRDSAQTHGELVRENRELRNQLLIANARLVRLGSAVADNAQLRHLLGVAERGGLDVQLAPILDIDLDPTQQRLVLAAGSRDGVKMGQAVIDAGGLMGQVIAVTPMQSTVLLLTDPDHAVPVTVVGSGVRLIAYGRGDALELRDVPLNSGVKAGDKVVTSGLGGRFPAGFPVGTVTDVHADESHTFLVGELRPAAQLDRGRDVLLLRSLPPVPVPSPAAPPSAAPADPLPTATGAGKAAGPSVAAPPATALPALAAKRPASPAARAAVTTESEGPSRAAARDGATTAPAGRDESAKPVDGAAHDGKTQ